MANQIITLRLISDIIKSNLEEVDQDVMGNAVVSTANTDYVKINNLNYKFVNCRETKSKIAWILASLWDPESKHRNGNFKITNWNTGGVVLNFTGKYSRGLIGDQEFKAYLTSRLTLPYIATRAMTCNLHPDSNLRQDVLHPLLCRGQGRRNWSKGRHNRVMAKLEEFLKDMVKKIHPDTQYQGRRVGKVDLKIGEEDTRYNAAGRQIVPDFVLYLNADEVTQRPFTYDLTCRDSHARRFISTNPLQRLLLKQGQASEYARAEKARIYEGAHTPGEADCVTLGFESNGFVSPGVHDFLIFLLQLGASQQRVQRLKQSIAETIAIQNGLAIMDSYAQAFEAEIQAEQRRNEAERVNYQRATLGSECGFVPEDGNLLEVIVEHEGSTGPSAQCSSSSLVDDNQN